MQFPGVVFDGNVAVADVTEPALALCTSCGAGGVVQAT
jgi:hypothetical protein